MLENCKQHKLFSIFKTYHHLAIIHTFSTVFFLFPYKTSLDHTVYDAKLDAVRAVLYASLVDIVKMLQESRADRTGGDKGQGQ